MSSQARPSSIDGDLFKNFERLSPGPLLEGELVSLSGRGNLRIKYDWKYSALNCDSGQESPFSWTISKTSAGRVSLSPTDLHNNMRLYASTRPDNDLNISVQAAISAHWITQVRADEEYTLDAPGGIIYRLKGFNDNYVTVDGQRTDHGGYSAFRVRSSGTTSSDACLWALGVSRVHQASPSVRLRYDLTEDDVRRDYALAGAGELDADRLKLVMAGLHRI